MGRNQKKVVGVGSNVTLNQFGSYTVLELQGDVIKIKDSATEQEITIDIKTNLLEVIL